MEQNLSITRGDTASFNLQFVNFDGDLANDLESMLLTVKESINGSAVFQKSLGSGISAISDGIYVVRIAPEDTEDLNLGYYYYDLEIRLNNDVFTMLKGVMEITYDVTSPTESVIIDPYAELRDIRVAYDGAVYPTAGDAVRTQIRDLHTDVDVLDGRVDAIASLPEGSTTGDAELRDIRVGANGVVYPTAGDAVRGQVNELNDDMHDTRNALSDTDNNVAVLESRMDTFTSLEEGSTTGDAELQDIRVGANGAVYPTAGDAVREQVGTLNDNIGDISKIVRGKNRFNIDDIVEGYYLNSDGTYIQNANWSISNFCYVKDLENIIGSYIDNIETGHRTGQGLWFACTYNENKEFVRYLGNSPGQTVAIQTGDVYLRFCFNSSYTYENEIQVESGTTATVYEPFNEKRIINDSADSDRVQNNTSLLNKISNGFENVIKSVNKFNGVFTLDGYLSNAGLILPSTGFVTTDFIDVEGYDYIVASANDTSDNTKRVAINLYYCCEYDQNKQFLRQLGTNLGAFVALTGDAKYIRFSPFKQFLNNDIQVECGKAMTPYNLYDDVEIVKPENLPHKLEILLQQSIIKTSKNLYRGGLVSGYLISNGTIDAHATFKTCDYIDVHGLDYVTASCANGASRQDLNMFYCCAYDENKNFVKQYGSMPGATLAIDDDTYYIRFSRGDFDSLVDIQVESGTTRSSYVPYSESIDLGSNLSQRWSNKKWTCVGDSLTENNTRTSIHYFDYISQYTGIQVVNMGVSGTGYARGSDNNNAFYQRISNVPTDSDVVTIFGSGNDGGAGLQLGTATDTGTNTLGGCINTTIDNLYAIMPLVQLGIVTPSPWIGNMPYDDGWMENYSNLIVEICRNRSIPCLDLFHCSNLDPNSADVRAEAYSKDDGGGVHPDENGHKIIAPRFEWFLDSLLLH